VKIAVACDHRGFNAKERLLAMLAEQGHSVIDFGCKSEESCDYPDQGFPAAQSVASKDADVAVLMCGTGIGMSITANKVAGIRAAVCHDELTAELSRRHNDANVLCLPADLIGEALIRRVIDVWLRTKFDEGRHVRRVGKIKQFETDQNET
jgi:ribose 5-phosphate isomerase B